MSTARKYSSNQRSMSRQSRNNAYAAINILWLQMRPDLCFEDKETIRDERLAWIAGFLGLKLLDSTTKLSDGQIGKVLEEMKRLTGQVPKQTKSNTKSQFSTNLRLVENMPTGDGAEIIHLASEEQKFTLEKLDRYIKWRNREAFYKTRKLTTNFAMLKFDQATSLTMILLNIAAHQDLKERGKTRISRAMTAKYISVLKKKLEIDQK